MELRHTGKHQYSLTLTYNERGAKMLIFILGFAIGFIAGALVAVDIVLDKIDKKIRGNNK